MALEYWLRVEVSVSLVPKDLTPVYKEVASLTDYLPGKLV